MLRRIRRISLAEPALLLLLLGLAGCGSRSRSEATPEEQPAPAAVPIHATVVERRDLVLSKTYSGSLEGEEQANIVGKVPERIVGILARVGDVVRAGQVLVTLDRSGSSSQYYQAEANFKNAEKSLARLQSLYQAGAVSLQSLDAAQTAYDIARANFEAARNTVELTTPIAGVVTAVNANVGDLVNPANALMTVAQIGRLKVIFNVGESDIPNFAVGNPVRVYSEVRPDLKVEGRIFQLAKSADLRSRSFEIRAQCANTPDEWLKPGMFVKVDIAFPPRQQTLTLPDAALQSDGVEHRVFVVRGGRSFRQGVRIGASDGRFTEVLQGLAAGDTVATAGTNNLKDSTAVSVVAETGQEQPR